MAKVEPSNGTVTVRDAQTGRTLTVRGAGALKGRLNLRKDIDLTKPIAAQVFKDIGSSGPASAKR